jgi:hypothetical protein
LLASKITILGLTDSGGNLNFNPGAKKSGMQAIIAEIGGQKIKAMELLPSVQLPNIKIHTNAPVNQGPTENPAIFGGFTIVAQFTPVIKNIQPINARMFWTGSVDKDDIIQENIDNQIRVCQEKARGGVSSFCIPLKTLIITSTLTVY